MYKVTYKHATWSEQYELEDIKKVAEVISELVEKRCYDEALFKIEYVAD